MHSGIVPSCGYTFMPSAGGCLQSCRLYIGLATDWESDVRSRETCRSIAFIIDSRACSFFIDVLSHKCVSAKPLEL